MLVGAHVSIAGGLPLAPARAHALGCECFQIFSRSPRGGSPPPLTSETISQFKEECKKQNQKACYIHTPYFINFASKEPRIRWSSIAVVREELERADALGIDGVVTHLGSGKDYGREKGIEKVIRAVHHVLEKYEGKTPLLLELSAGAGGEQGIIGSTLEEIAHISTGVKKIEKRYSRLIGVCLDTCHAFASGYDLRTAPAVDAFLQKVKKTVGLKAVKLIHANDSQHGLASHKDRHAHIGDGEIGAEGFRALVRHSAVQGIPVIVETPTAEGMKRDIAFLKKERRGRRKNHE